MATGIARGGGGGGGGAEIAGDLGGTTAAPTIEGIQGEDLPDSVGDRIIKRNTANDAWVLVPYTGTNLTTDLSAKAATATTVTAGAGLTGGGDLSANRTLTVGAGTGITVNADDVAVNAAALATDGFGALTDVTTNDATTSQHGFAPKATAPAAGLLSVLAIGNGATVRSDTAIFDTTNPAALGVAAPGTALVAARRDHVHATPSTDITGLTAATDFKPLTDYIPVYDASAAANRKFLFSEMRSGRNYSVIAEEFWHATATRFDGGLGDGSSGGGSIALVTSGEVGHPGTILCTTAAGSGNAGYNHVNATTVLLGSGKWRTTVIVKTPAAVSDGTNTYTLAFGLGDNGPFGGTDSVQIRYAHSVNSGKWQGACRSNGAGNETLLDLNVTLVAATWYCLEIEVNAAASSVEFFTDGVSRGTIATNIPSGAGRYTSVAGGITSSAGAASACTIDFVGLIYEPTTAR